MNILDKITAHKRKLVEENKSLYPIKLLEQSIYFDSPTVSLCQYLKRSDRVGIIAEIKRHSPSEGMINEFVNIEQASIGYMQAGASALSILTDKEFFKGSNEDLTTARKFNFCPILRKDFVLDEYQIVEAKSIGADAILLIAACLDVDECKRLASFAKSLNLEVLLEIHREEEIYSHLNEHIDLVGVNNRNLEDFTVSIQTSLDLLNLLPADIVKISESGISQPGDVARLKQAGFDGFLIGSFFMRQGHPEKACYDFIRNTQNLLGERTTTA